MKSIAIKCSWLLESDVRLDAAYHLSDGPLTKLKLKNSPYKISTLELESKDIFKGNIFKRIYVSNPKKGYELLTASDMVKADIFSDKYISKKFTKESKLLLSKGWILVSRSGSLGNTVFTNEDFERTIGSDDLIRIVPKNLEVKSGFLYAYLSSKHGFGLLTQSGYGGVIQHIEPHHLTNLPVPVIPEGKQQVVHSLIIESSSHRVKSHKSLLLSLRYFESKFAEPSGYKTIFTKNVKKFNFSWVGKNNDAIAETSESLIKNLEHLIIRGLSNRVYAPPLFKHIYLDTNNGYPFFTGADVAKSFKRPYRYLSKLGVGNIHDYVVNEKQILVYKSGPRNGMLGNTFLVDQSIKNSCLSDHVIRIEIDDENLRYWTFAFLRSKVGLRQLHNIATGTAILFITPNRLANLSIPAPDEGYKEVCSNVKDYYDNLNLAYIKELQAIEIVEKEIESWQNS